MQTEVQIKIRVNNFLGIKKKIEESAKFTDEEDKIDYFFKGNFKFDRTELRLRKKGNEKKVTLKVNYFDKNIEKNEEYEFKLDYATDFVRILDLLGIEVVAMQHKKSYFYLYKGIKVQLVAIKELGNFLEVEKKCDDSCSYNWCRKEILDLIKKWGINKEMIEKRSYFEILMEKKSKEKGD